MPDQQLLKILRRAHDALTVNNTSAAYDAIADAALHAHRSSDRIRLRVDPELGSAFEGLGLYGATTYEITVDDGRAEIRDVKRQSIAQRGPSAWLTVGLPPMDVAM